MSLSPHIGSSATMQCCLEEAERGILQVVTRIIPTSPLHSFDLTLDKLLVEYNVIEQAHFSPRTGAEKQTVMLRGAHTSDANGNTTYSTGVIFKGYADNSMQVERHYAIYGRVVLSFMGAGAQYELGTIVTDFSINGAKEKQHVYSIATRFPSDATPLLNVKFHPEGWINEMALCVNFSQMPLMRGEVERMLRNGAISELLELTKATRLSVVLDAASMKERRKAHSSLLK